MASRNGRMPGIGRILGLALDDGADAGQLDVFRGFEIGLAGGQPDDVAPLADQLRRAGRRRRCRGLFDGTQVLGNHVHGLPPGAGIGRPPPRAIRLWHSRMVPRRSPGFQVSVGHIIKDCDFI